MNKLVKVADLTAEEKAMVKLPYGTEWEDVGAINFQLRKDGSVANYSIVMDYSDEKLEELRQPTMMDIINVLFANKHSKQYQASKKHLGVSNDDINAARRVMKRGN